MTLGLAAAAASPALAEPFLFGAPPSFSYQSPDGSYPSLADTVNAVNGVPCGIECSQRAAVRWGLVPPPPAYYYYYGRRPY